MTSELTPDDISDMETLCVGQCCSLKIDTGSARVWVCRVRGGITTEHLDPDEGWRVADGGCYAPSVEDPR